MQRAAASRGEPGPPETAAEGPAPPARLLGFYDRLRARVHDGIARRGGRAGGTAADALLLAPDLFMLLARLSLDRSVPAASRSLIGGALLYFLLPTDLFPEAFVGIGGYADDLLIACAVLAEAFGRDLESWTAQHWSGSRRLETVIGDVARSAETLLGADLSTRVDRFLRRRGVRIGR